MAVVINEFEVLGPPAALSQPGTAEQGGADAAKPKPLQAKDVQQALRALQQQALRVWAH